MKYTLAIVMLLAVTATSVEAMSVAKHAANVRDAKTIEVEEKKELSLAYQTLHVLHKNHLHIDGLHLEESVNDEANIQIGGGANHAAKEVEDKKENALI
jgi:hypothetical protein